MQKEKIMQFVTFETILDTEEFISHWEKFTRSDETDHVMLHQSKKDDIFKYIAKHPHGGGFKFIFEKARRSSKNRQVAIKVIQEGGYSLSQLSRSGECHSNESKIFCFIQNPQADLKAYKNISPHTDCNVYVAYYENCRFAYILEFFVKNNHASELLERLKTFEYDEVGIYKECEMQLS